MSKNANVPLPTPPYGSDHVTGSAGLGVPNGFVPLSPVNASVNGKELPVILKIEMIGVRLTLTWIVADVSVPRFGLNSGRSATSVDCVDWVKLVETLLYVTESADAFATPNAESNPAAINEYARFFILFPIPNHKEFGHKIRPTTPAITIADSTST